MKAIFERRSIRKYTNEKISDEVLQHLLKAGMAGPSAMNVQPWEFIIIRNRETLLKITEFHPYSQMLKEADVAIAVCGDEVKSQRFWVQDCSAAAENILLAAQAQGLGGVWLGVYPIEKRVSDVKRLLELPEYVSPLCIISLGYPAEDRPVIEKYDETKVHYDRW